MLLPPASPATNMAGNPFPKMILILAAAFVVTSNASIGVNYGTLGDNLPPPQQVAEFIRTRTIVDRVKLFNSDANLIQAFAGTGIAVTISVANDQIVPFTIPGYAAQWVSSHVAPYVPATNINRIAVGNEILLGSDEALISHLVPAMRSLHDALSAAGLGRIQVSSPHALNIVTIIWPPSAGEFRYGYEKLILRPMLQFLRDTRSPFMVNPYPYFGYSPETLNYAIFRRNPGKRDPATGHLYTNMFDQMLDAIYSAMKRIGYGDVEIVVAETGWPTAAQPGQTGVSVRDARSYNRKLIRHVMSGQGTPLMPGKRFETFLFALFNENLKPGPIAERNWGLFYPNVTPVYDAGIMRPQGGGGSVPVVPPASKVWCLPTVGASDAALLANIDWACGAGGVDCSPIHPGGACMEPNTIRSHASYVMNAYYQKAGRTPFNCDFSHTGTITTVNPSYGACIYNA